MSAEQILFENINFPYAKQAPKTTMEIIFNVL